MPLSEHEQRVLEQIERSLYAEDPKFRATVNKTTRKRVSFGGLRVAIGLGVIGLAVLVGGVWLQNVIVGVLGFLIMFAGGVIGIRGSQAGPSDKPRKGAKKSANGGGKGSMTTKAQDRLRRRFDEQQ